MAFTGRATDSVGVFDESPEDVSPLVTLISPHETPTLDVIGDSQHACVKPFHEWLEDSLTPNSVTLGAAVPTDAPGASRTITLNANVANFIMDGMILIAPDGEYMRVTAVPANNQLTVTRGFGGTAIAGGGIANGVVIEVITTAQPEGRAVSRDVSKNRPRQGNHTHLVMTDIMISGTEDEGSANIGGFKEWDYQVQNRLRESLRDLNKAVIRMIPSGNEPGGANSIRAMKGIFNFITTNNDTHPTFTEANLKATTKKAWLQGGSDLDCIICGVGVKEAIDGLNGSRIRTDPKDRVHTNVVDVYENTYGKFSVIMDRWMPAGRCAIVSTKRMAVVPLQGRHFRQREISPTGDNRIGFIRGEYTLELRNQAGMAQCVFSDIAAAVTP